MLVGKDANQPSASDTDLDHAAGAPRKEANLGAVPVLPPSDAATRDADVTGVVPRGLRAEHFNAK